MCASVCVSTNSSSRTSSSASSMSSLLSREGVGCLLLPHCRLSHRFSFLFIFLICLSVSGLSLLCSSPSLLRSPQLSSPSHQLFPLECLQLQSSGASTYQA